MATNIPCHLSDKSCCGTTCNPGRPWQTLLGQGKWNAVHPMAVTPGVCGLYNIESDCQAKRGTGDVGCRLKMQAKRKKSEEAKSPKLCGLVHIMMAGAGGGTVPSVQSVVAWRFSVQLLSSAGSGCQPLFSATCSAMPHDTNQKGKNSSTYVD